MIISCENRKILLNLFHKILKFNYLNYDSKDFSVEYIIDDESEFCLYQDFLSKVNEISEERKNKGVYYTPKDVTEFIISNALMNYIVHDNDCVLTIDEFYEYILTCENDLINDLLYKANIIDPTSGSGEFIISAFTMKIHILELINNIDDMNILKVLQTLSFNDIDTKSTEIIKVRLFLYLVKQLKEIDSLKKAISILNKNEYNVDFINYENKLNKKFDIIIGNPPYVEDYKYNGIVNHKFGNVYANVLNNSIELLSSKGVIGFIIPLSYMSTVRMNKIRTVISSKCKKQFMLSYADRPDCLFAGVHQKLTILIGSQNNNRKIKYTGTYKHWYKEERKDLFNNTIVVENDNKNPSFIPKYGCEIEKNIYNKILNKSKHGLNYLLNKGNEQIYLNMRATFWIKCFPEFKESKEYKAYPCNEKYRNYLLCILNSTLFYMFWTIVSDCWHITSKELALFKIADKGVNLSNYDILARRLFDELEKTKVYIGTKQAEYAYKHKECKQIIDEIDELLSQEYNLNENELEYIKKYNLKYRTGGGNIE